MLALASFEPRAAIDTCAMIIIIIASIHSPRDAPPPAPPPVSLESWPRKATHYGDCTLFRPPSCCVHDAPGAAAPLLELCVDRIHAFNHSVPNQASGDDDATVHEMMRPGSGPLQSLQHERS